MIEITDEMKAKCMSEFSLTVADACPKCAIAFPGADCVCDGSGEYEKKVLVPWTTCKEIYKAMFAASPVPAELAALRAENERQNKACRYTADLIEQALAENEALKSELTENQKYTLQLEKRVAELENDLRRAVD